MPQTPLELALDEYRRWRDFDPPDADSQMMQLGAIAASANIVGKLVMTAAQAKAIEKKLDELDLPGQEVKS